MQERLGTLLSGTASEMAGERADFDDLVGARAYVEAMPKQGAVVLGKWGPSETLQHLAQSIEYSMDGGYPEMSPVVLRRTVGPVAGAVVRRRGYLGHDLTAVVPGAPALDAHVSVEEARARLLRAIDRYLAFQGQPAEHFKLGRLSKETFATMHALHIKDHMPYMQPGSAALAPAADI